MATEKLRYNSRIKQFIKPDLDSALRNCKVIKGEYGGFMKPL